MTTTVTSLENEIVRLARRARAASRRLAGLSTGAKNALLEDLAHRLSQAGARETLLAANARDLEAGARKGLTGALLDRLKLDSKRMDSMIRGLREVARLPDPVGVDRQSWTRPNGLQVAKRTIPLGVIGIIYEARPNVTIDAFALCFKAGNATVLKGGSEAIHSNRALVDLVGETLAPAGLSDACRLLDTTDRNAIAIMVRQEEFIDLIIPRGGEGLIRFVAATSRIPVIKHYKGVCNIYVDEEADLEKALSIAENAKISRPAVCNAVENLLIHEKAAGRFLPRLARRMDQAGVELRGDDRTREILPGATPATDEDYHEEFPRPDPGREGRLEPGRGRRPHRNLWFRPHRSHRHRKPGHGRGVPEPGQLLGGPGQCLHSLFRRRRAGSGRRDRNQHHPPARLWTHGAGEPGDGEVRHRGGRPDPGVNHSSGSRTFAR